MKEEQILWIIVAILVVLSIGILYYTDAPPVGEANVYASFTVKDQCMVAKSVYSDSGLNPARVLLECKGECVHKETGRIAPLYTRSFLFWSWISDTHCVKKDARVLLPA